MKMQDFMQKIKEKKLKRSDWLILVLAGILILIIALPTDTKEKKQAEKSKENISKENNTMEASKDEIERKLEDILKNRRSRRCKGDDYLSGQWDAGGGKG